MLEKLIHENEAAIGGEKAHAALIALARLQGKAVGFPGLKPVELDELDAGFVTKDGLAALLKCHVRTIENLMNARKIPFIKLTAKLVRFDWEKVKERLNSERN